MENANFETNYSVKLIIVAESVLKERVGTCDGFFLTAQCIKRSSEVAFLEFLKLEDSKFLIKFPPKKNS